MPSEVELIPKVKEYFGDIWLKIADILGVAIEQATKAPHKHESNKLVQTDKFATFKLK